MSAHLDVELGDVLGEDGAVRRRRRVRPLLELLARRRVGARAEEVRLDDGGQTGGGHVALEHLLGVVPAHAALRQPAPDEHHVAREAAAQAAQRLERGEITASRLEVGRQELALAEPRRDFLHAQLRRETCRRHVSRGERRQCQGEQGVQHERCRSNETGMREFWSFAGAACEIARGASPTRGS